MSARSKARKRALDVLYEADVRSLDPMAVLSQVTDRRVEHEGVSPHEYTVAIVEGVAARRDRIDEIIQTHSQGWVISRMPVIDRNILRMAAYELLWGRQAPDAVIIDEAVGLCKELSTEDSPGFINGVLAKVLVERPLLELAD
jgi:N utilization substance protein B